MFFCGVLYYLGCLLRLTSSHRSVCLEHDGVQRSEPDARLQDLPERSVLGGGLQPGSRRGGRVQQHYVCFPDERSSRDFCCQSVEAGPIPQQQRNAVAVRKG